MSADPSTINPIEEALIDLRIKRSHPEAPWDWSEPWRLHQHPALQELFDGRFEVPFVGRVTVELGLAAPEIASAMPPVRVRSWSKDEGRMLAVGPDGCSVHILRPYPGWTSCRPWVERALGAYLEALAPVTVSALTVRYVNRWPLEGGLGEVSRHLRGIAPTDLPDGAVLKDFLRRQRVELADGATRVTVHQAVVHDKGQVFAMADIEARRPCAQGEVVQLMESIEALRGVVKSTFITNTTEEARRGLQIE